MTRPWKLSVILNKQSQMLISLLSYPTQNAPTNSITDWCFSNTAVGAVIQQLIDNTWRPITFFSKTLTSQETRYSTFDHELRTSSLSSHQKFSTFYWRTSISFYQPTTNHWSLHYNHIPSTFQDIYVDFVSQFICDIPHVSGTDNCVADALPQIEISTLHQSPPTVQS